MKKKNEFHWNVMIWDINKDALVSYDVGPRFTCEYKALKKKERDNFDIADFLDNMARYHFWAKCEYEMICTGWPKFKNDYKLDVYEQLKINWDNFVDTFKRWIES